MQFDYTVICQFKFLCDQRWENLATIPNEPSIRFCNVCNKQVYLTDSLKELKKQFSENRCAAIYLESSETITFGLIGGPLYEEILVDYDGSLSKFDPILFRLVEDLELMSSTKDKLKINGIYFIGDLITCNKVQLIEGFGFSENQMNEILEKLSDFGLSLEMSIPNWKIESVNLRRALILSK